MDQVLQGGQYTGRVLYRLGSGPLVDPTDPYMDLLAPDGTNVSPHTLLTKDDVGEYHVTFTVPTDAQVGTWTMQFYGIIGGGEVTAPDEFEVIEAGLASPIVQTTLQIRMLLGERIPIGKDETATRFTDTEIIAMYYADNQDLNKTMADMWMSKAGMWAELVDYDESGTERAMSQMQKAALSQAKVYQGIVQAYESQWQSTYRVPGRSFAAWGQDYCAPVILWEPVTCRG